MCSSGHHNPPIFQVHLDSGPGRPALDGGHHDEDQVSRELRHTNQKQMVRLPVRVIAILRGALEVLEGEHSTDR